MLAIIFVMLSVATSSGGQNPEGHYTVLHATEGAGAVNGLNRGDC